MGQGMKILFLITGLGGGGAEKVVIDLADEMFKKGHQVKIAYLKGEVIVRPKNKEIELVYLGLESFSNIFQCFKNYKKIIESYQPDVVHSHMVHANIFARISRNFIKMKRLICSAHSNNEGGRLRMLAYRLTHQLSEITTNVSIDAALNFEKLNAVPKGKILTIYNGIDLTRFDKRDANESLRSELGLDIHTRIFLAVGRFHDAKDYPNLLNAFAIFKATNFFKENNSKLIIAGDGELRDEVESLIRKLGIQSEVILLGRREDIPVLLNSVDYFVLSSKYEGLPTVVIEAMACEVFVISTDCGGSKEIMGATGMLVPVQNSPVLAAAFAKVVTLKNSEIIMNNKIARKRVEEQFSLNSSVSNWLKIYES